MIGTQRSIMCIKRYLNPYKASWKYFLDFYLSQQVGGKFLFHCNFNYSKLPISLPDYYKECIVSWASLSSINPSSVSEISNQWWNNRFICIDSPASRCLLISKWTCEKNIPQSFLSTAKKIPKYSSKRFFFLLVVKNRLKAF